MSEWKTYSAEEHDSIVYSLNQQIERLQAELTEAKKDAERFKWVIKNPYMFSDLWFYSIIAKDDVKDYIRKSIDGLKKET